jgi:hypothetical protein
MLRSVKICSTLDSWISMISEMSTPRLSRARENRPEEEEGMGGLSPENGTDVLSAEGEALGDDTSERFRPGEVAKPGFVNEETGVGF